MTQPVQQCCLVVRHLRATSVALSVAVALGRHRKLKHRALAALCSCGRQLMEAELIGQSVS